VRGVGAGYEPAMSAEQAERIRQHHEAHYERRTTAPATEQTLEYLGLTLVVPPEVHPVNPTSRLLGDAVLAEVREDDRVLDMGTGSGVNAILAASRSLDVLAVDVNEYALAAAQNNVERNGVADRVTVRRSDVFSTVDGTFDLIVFDPPFRWFAPRDIRETASTDENYRTMTAFFCGVRARLTDRGRLLMFFGSSGDLAYLRRLADEAGFTVERLAHVEDTHDDGWVVGYSAFRLTPGLTQRP
jgi:release factor glutamine methyltransferase